MAEVLPDLSVTEWAVLGVVAEHDTHGFSVARLFEPTGTVGRVWTVPRPLVYRAIDSLVEHDLVQRVGSAPGAGGPRRTVLAVTPTGAGALRRWLTEPIIHVRDARSHLLVKLLLIDRAGGDPTPLVLHQRELLASMADGLETQLAHASGFDAVLLRWRLYSVQNLDRFLAEVPTPRRRAQRATTKRAG